MDGWELLDPVQEASQGLAPAITGAAMGVCTIVALKTAAMSRRLLSPPRTISPRLTLRLPSILVPLLGIAIAVGSTNTVRARKRSTPLVRRRVLASEPPWSRTGGFPPPRPPVPAGHDQPALPDRRHANSRTPRTSCVEVHPAIHGDGRVCADHRPLFGRHRASNRNGNRSDALTQKDYVVEPGDTLWSIAARALGTDDARRIARYWPKIHRRNRAILGSNPNLIYPGQKLRLPGEDDVDG